MSATIDTIVGDDTDIPIQAGLVGSLLRCAWATGGDGYEAATVALLRLCEAAPSYVEDLFGRIQIVDGEYRAFEILDFLLGYYGFRNAEVDAGLVATLRDKHAKLTAKLRAEGYPMPSASDDDEGYLRHLPDCGICWFGRELSFIRSYERDSAELAEGIDEMAGDAWTAIDIALECGWKDHEKASDHIHDRARDAAEFTAVWRRSADAPPTRPRVIEYMAGQR